MKKLFIQVSFKPDKVGHTASLLIFVQTLSTLDSRYILL